VGSLSLPASGLVYVDTQILIYTVERHTVYEPLLRSVWQAAGLGTIEVTSSELALMETLVRPLKTGDTALQADYERALCGTDLRLLPITLPILREAARLRATFTGLRTPDALHAATALLSCCVLFLTNDHDFLRIPGLPVALLDHSLTP
jgi:predicted nucleic acid-binding protein